MTTTTDKERKKFFRSLTHDYPKDFKRYTATPEKPFRFMKVMVMEAAEYSWYKDLVGTEQLIYLHGFLHEDGTFEVDYYCAFKRIKKDRIEIIGKFKKEHLDI